MKTVVIIGGGITGLSTAYYLQKKVQEGCHDVRIVVVEASDRLGGKIRTHHEGEFIMETGADSIVSRKSNVSPLLHELHLADEIVYNATGKSFIYADNQLKMIPEDTIFGIPMSIESLAKSNLVSAAGKVEALKDFYTKNETFTKNDSVGEFLAYFLGEELVEKQISPVLSGVYSGKLTDLTLASTLPYLLEYKNQYGSIIAGLSENKQKFLGSGKHKFLSFKRGVSTLVDAIENQLVDVEVIKGVKAARIRKSAEGDTYTVELAGQEMLEADYIVLSTQDSAAQALLNSKELDKEFNQLKNSSLISVYLGFNVPDEVLPEDGTGYIVAENSTLTCNACTWTSRKWDHTSEHKKLLVRLFYKSSGADYPKLESMTDAELLQVAQQDIKNSLGIVSDPVTYNVTKWQDTMPNYHIKHHEIVQSLEEKMERSFPNIILAGCSYYGVGIADCILNGENTATRIAAQI